MKTPFLFIPLIASVFLFFSCGETHVDPPLSSEEMGLKVKLENNDGSSPFFMYGPRNIDFSVSSAKGTVESVQIFYQGKEIGSFAGNSGIFSFSPDMSKEGETSLQMKVTVTVGQQKYNETIDYKVAYVKLSEEDFELKDATIDRFIFKMTGKRLDNYKYVTYDGIIIGDLDNIVIERKDYPQIFPTVVDIELKIMLVPIEEDYKKGQFYPSVKLSMGDKTLGDFDTGYTLSHYIDAAHEELYVWSGKELSVFDKEMNEVKNQPMEQVHFVAVTPKTGLVIIRPLYENIVVYSDKNFNTVISNIDLEMNTGILRVNEKDQLLNGHNFMIDVYDLHTGDLVYSLEFPEHVNNYTLSGDKLFVKLGNDGTHQVYQLNEKSATLLYSFVKDYMHPIAHPVNHNHIILDAAYNGFEIFDLESRTSVFTSKGQFQSIDPITGSLLYYDENYGVKDSYPNHVIDLEYNKIFTFEDASKTSYGAFLQFNNYIIKSDRYIGLLPQDNK